METAPLKAFATWARTSLIVEVSARIATVLAPASIERVEQAKAVIALEKAIAASGGGAEGRAAVADRVAYTWFNRIIALRFMDANGYTGIRVVSAQAGVEVGQPEILADAKRGYFDSTVVGARTQEVILGLLNGTRRSDDAQGEAYALLLAEYCRHWNRAMPFMFEREGDFTELLIPANLLADDSVLTRAVEVLSNEVCQDVEVIGWLYQFYIAERKDEVFAGFKKNKKAGAAEVPAATQLFTPHWIVRYLVENSLGRLWMLNRPDSRLVDQMDYYIAPVDKEIDFLKLNGPEELKVMDPACGSGHMLTYAFDLLYAIYEEEGYAPADIPSLVLRKNLYGAEIDSRAGALAAFALTMKARGKQRNFSGSGIQPSICVLQNFSFTEDELEQLDPTEGAKRSVNFWQTFSCADLYGSLLQPDESLIPSMNASVDALDSSGQIYMADLVDRARTVLAQAEYLSRRYHVVVTNPPYMGNKNMGRALADFLRANYWDAKADLMTAMLQRQQSLTMPQGYWSAITLHSWMFLSSFEAFRKTLLGTQTITSMCHLGRGIFGSDSGTVALTVRNSAPTETDATDFRRLFDEQVSVRSPSAIEGLFHDEGQGRYRVSQCELLGIPGAPIAYWLEARLRLAFQRWPLMEDCAAPRVGMQTSNNAKYLRYWWEIEPYDLEGDGSLAPRWIKYLKGGAFRRWYGNLEHVLHFAGDPKYILSQPNATVLPLSRLEEYKLTWSDVSWTFNARVAPSDCFHDISGHCMYPKAEDGPWLLAYVNSQLFQHFIEAINSSFHFQVGDVAKVPIPPLDRYAAAALSSRAIEISKWDWDSQEISLDFSSMRILDYRGDQTRLESAFIAFQVDSAAATEELRAIEESIDQLVDASAGMHGEHVSRDISSISILANSDYRFAKSGDDVDTARLARSGNARDLISFAVGCMLGRFSLDSPGLLALGARGRNPTEGLSRVPAPTFSPDEDNVIPILAEEWFPDDIVGRFREFLKVAFGEVHYQENLRFLEEALGKDVRRYFLADFYKDHVQRYKKRPIYWMFSSPKGSFNALIYMHRYTPSTVSTVLNEYLREFSAKLAASLAQQERFVTGSGTPRQLAAAQKEADRLRKVLLELEEYERNVLYPLASRQVSIDLDDGVKVNYPKFGAALKKVPGLEGSDE